VIDRIGSRMVASGPCGWGVSLLCSSRVACKKERGRRSCTNALPSTDASPLDVPAVQNPNGMASSIYGVAGDVFGEEQAAQTSHQRRTLSHLCSPYSRPIARSLDSTAECRTPFRGPLQCIVIAVMSVMSGTFPHTYGVFYVTVNRWRVRGSSRHRHGYRHRGKGLGMRFSRFCDGDDAHDDPLRAYSRRGGASTS
jgi:hypothetical protein